VFQDTMVENARRITGINNGFERGFVLVT